jgi:hypothetical protein
MSQGLVQDILEVEDMHLVEEDTLVDYLVEELNKDSLFLYIKYIYSYIIKVLK